MIGHWGSVTSGRSESAEIAQWVETHYAPSTIDDVIVYDLTQAPRNS
jgi:hypothetical protein